VRINSRRAAPGRVISKGGKAPADGVTKGKEPPKTKFQKLLEKWPPKVK
jgi:hypothetical protein